MSYVCVCVCVCVCACSVRERPLSGVRCGQCGRRLVVRDGPRRPTERCPNSQQDAGPTRPPELLATPPPDPRSPSRPAPTKQPLLRLLTETCQLYSGRSQRSLKPRPLSYKGSIGRGRGLTPGRGWGLTPGRGRGLTPGRGRTSKMQITFQSWE